MNSNERLETLRRYVYRNRGDQVYGVLDGASIPRLLSLLEQHAVANVCLFRGELDPEVAMTAPYLVQLPTKSAFTDLVLQQGWGHHWGILAVSQADLRAMRLHLRKFTMVLDPAGKPLYFRYYDPRVLRNYLPSCNGEELRTVFGPVNAYLMEGKAPDVALRFTVEGQAPDCETLTLPPQRSV